MPGRLVHSSFDSLLSLLAASHVAANGHCPSDGFRALAERYQVGWLDQCG